MLRKVHAWNCSISVDLTLFCQLLLVDRSQEFVISVLRDQDYVALSKGYGAGVTRPVHSKKKKNAHLQAKGHYFSSTYRLTFLSIGYFQISPNYWMPNMPKQQICFNMLQASKGYRSSHHKMYLLSKYRNVSVKWKFLFLKVLKTLWKREH